MPREAAPRKGKERKGKERKGWQHTRRTHRAPHLCSVEGLRQPLLAQLRRQGGGAAGDERRQQAVALRRPASPQLEEQVPGVLQGPLVQHPSGHQARGRIGQADGVWGRRRGQAPRARSSCRGHGRCVRVRLVMSDDIARPHPTKAEYQCSSSKHIPWSLAAARRSAGGAPSSPAPRPGRQPRPRAARRLTGSSAGGGILGSRTASRQSCAASCSASPPSSPAASGRRPSSSAAASV